MRGYESHRNKRGTHPSARACQPRYFGATSKKLVWNLLLCEKPGAQSKQTKSVGLLSDASTREDSRCAMRTDVQMPSDRHAPQSSRADKTTDTGKQNRRPIWHCISLTDGTSPNDFLSATGWAVMVCWESLRFIGISSIRRPGGWRRTRKCWPRPQTRWQ